MQFGDDIEMVVKGIGCEGCGSAPCSVARLCKYGEVLLGFIKPGKIIYF
jgi:hypothetical protein